MRNGKFGMARPCAHCLFAIKCAGLSRVFYSTGASHGSGIQVEKVDEMDFSHLSYFQLQHYVPNRTEDTQRNKSTHMSKSLLVHANNYKF